MIMKFKQAIFVFFLVIMFILSYCWFDQKAGITFTSYFYFYWGMPKLVCPKSV